MKILLDENITGLDKYLEMLGREVLTIEKLNLKGATDQEIIKYASENNLLTNTNDNDFAKLAKLKDVTCIHIDYQMLAKIVNEEIEKFLE